MSVFHSVVRQWLIFSIPVLALAFTGCQAAAQDNATQALTPVTLQVNWALDVSISPYYMAAADGHFADEGLDVSLVEGGFDEDGQRIDVVDRVMSGQAQFASANLFQVLQANANGKPVVALMTLIQRSPLTLITDSEAGIDSPRDLAGKTIAVDAGWGKLMIASLLTSQGVDLDSVTFVLRTDYSLDLLVSGQVDALTSWIDDGGYAYQQAGYTPHFIMPTEYGIDTYDMLLITTPQMIAQQPELVQKVVRAVLEGIEDVVANPNAAAQRGLDYNQNLDIEKETERLNLLLPLIHPAGSHIGMMDPKVFEDNYHLLLDNGLIAPFDVEQTYDLDFVASE